MLDFAYEPDEKCSRLTCQLEVTENLDGLIVIFFKTLDVKLSWSFSISKEKRLEDTNAISIPEKKAESKILMRITISETII